MPKLNYIAAVNAVLESVDIWISEIDDDDLADKTKQTGIEFLEFMTKRGIPARFIDEIIKKKMGVKLNRLHTLADYQKLRYSLAQHASTMATTATDEDYGKDDTALGNLKHFWGE